jgi:hypothetical protein
MNARWKVTAVAAPAALLLATVVTACSDQATAPRSHTPAIAADFMNNPDVGNGVVYRYGSDFAVCWTDFSNGLRACHRTQQFPSGDCGAFDPIGGIGVQEVVAVSDPDDFFASEVVVNMMGRLWITVRDLNQAGTCYGAQRAAEGWGSFHYTDNDEFGPDPAGHSRNNAYGFMAQGPLTAADGSPVGYSGHARMIAFGDGTIRHEMRVFVR